MWRPTPLAPEGGIPAHRTDAWSEKQALTVPYQGSIAHLFKEARFLLRKSKACATKEVVRICSFSCRMRSLLSHSSSCVFSSAPYCATLRHTAPHQMRDAR